MLTIRIPESVYALYRPPAPEIIVPGKELPMNHEAT
jgi:hypothetical protein